MSTSHGPVDRAAQAAAAADAAARRAGVRVEVLDDIDSIHQAARLFNLVWSAPENQPLVSSAMLRALSHSGNYVVAAFDGSNEMVGTAVGFIGLGDGASLLVHSHMTGVSSKLQGRNVGFAIKEHQRAWALARGINLVTWTFDPLVRRNAYFNVTKLGASITRYYSSFYGEMHDGTNDNDETDRVLIEWEVDSERATEASVGRLPEPDISELEASGAPVALAIGDDGQPVEGPTAGDVLLVAVPEDIVELRRRDAGLAHRWRLALRRVMGTALDGGYITTGMSKSGFYVLQRDG